MQSRVSRHWSVLLFFFFPFLVFPAQDELPPVSKLPRPASLRWHPVIPQINSAEYLNLYKPAATACSAAICHLKNYEFHFVFDDSAKKKKKVQRLEAGYVFFFFPLPSSATATARRLTVCRSNLTTFWESRRRRQKQRQGRGRAMSDEAKRCVAMAHNGRSIRFYHFRKTISESRGAVSRCVLLLPRPQKCCLFELNKYPVTLMCRSNRLEPNVLFFERL